MALVLGENGWQDTETGKPATEEQLNNMRASFGMSNINNATKGTEVPDVKQEEQKETKAPEEPEEPASQPVASNPTGIENPADYIGTIGANWDKKGYTDNTTGEKKSYNRGKKFTDNMAVAKEAGRRGTKTEDRFGNPLPDNAYDYINKRLEDMRARGNVTKEGLRSIQYAAQLHYNLPKNFDISGKGFGNWDAAMAKQMNSYAYNGKQSAQPAQTAPQETKAAEPEKTTEPQDVKPNAAAQSQKQPMTEQQPATTDAASEAFKRIKSKQASDADLAMFSKYSEEQLAKMGFGPVSIKAIKGVGKKDDGVISVGTKNTSAKETRANAITPEEQAILDKYNTAVSGYSHRRNVAANGKIIKELQQQAIEIQRKQQEAVKAQKAANKAQKNQQAIDYAKQQNAAYGSDGTFGE